MDNMSCEKKMKHLEMIEGIIERMGSNSFKLKGWAVTLVSVIGALSAQGSDKRFFLISFIPLLSFWLLDSYYLQLERKYKILYKNVLEKEEDKIDFNMNLQSIVCSDQDTLSIHYCKCLFSKSEILFYGVIAASILFLAIKFKAFV